MSNKEKTSYLLQDIRLLEKLIDEVKEDELYPVSFFSKSFELTHKILNDLHALEKEQVELMLAQMEKRKEALGAIPVSQPIEQPEPELPEPVEEDLLPSIEPELPEDEPAEEKDEPVTIMREAEMVTPGIKSSSSLSDVLEKKNLADFRKAFSLNDRFYFKRELFAGNEAMMSQVIRDLDELQSLEESLYYLDRTLNRSREDAPVADFIRLLEKRFS